MKKLLPVLFFALGVNICCAEKLQEVMLGDKKVILSADVMSSGYCHNMSLEMQRENVPDRVIMNVNGGYWPKLETVTLRPGENQLLLRVRQGGSGATSEYRIYRIIQGTWRDISTPKKKQNVKSEGEKSLSGKPSVKESKKSFTTNADEDEPKKTVVRERLKTIFDNTESFGLIQEAILGEKSLTVRLIDGTRQTIPLEDKIWERIENYYNRGYEPDFEGLISLIPYDGDGDGIQELYATQRMEMNNTDLGYVAARLDLQQDDSWKMSQYVLQLPSVPKKDDKLNAAVENDFYELYGERIYLPKCQGSYPVFYSANKTVMDKLNKSLIRDFKQDLRNLFTDDASMGFEVVLDYEKILSVRFVGGKHRYNHFHHYDPRNGNDVTLKNMFVVNNAFLKKISQLSPSGRVYSKGDLGNWYMKDTSFNILLEKDGKQRVEQFKLGAFEEFLNPKNELLKVNKNKDSKDKEKEKKE